MIRLCQSGFQHNYPHTIDQLKNQSVRGYFQNTEKLQPGADVMITIFQQFSPIFGEKIGVFLKKKQCYAQIFA
jgi:hypothetical protein